MVLSATINNPTWENAQGGTGRRLPQGALSKSTFCNENVRMTRATRRMTHATRPQQRQQQLAQDLWRYAPVEQTDVDTLCQVVNEARILMIRPLESAQTVGQAWQRKQAHLVETATPIVEIHCVEAILCVPRIAVA